MIPLPIKNLLGHFGGRLSASEMRLIESLFLRHELYDSNISQRLLLRSISWTSHVRYKLFLEPRVDFSLPTIAPGRGVLHQEEANIASIYIECLFGMLQSIDIHHVHPVDANREFGDFRLERLAASSDDWRPFPVPPEEIARIESRHRFTYPTEAREFYTSLDNCQKLLPFLCPLESGILNPDPDILYQVFMYIPSRGQLMFKLPLKPLPRVERIEMEFYDVIEESVRPFASTLRDTEDKAVKEFPDMFSFLTESMRH